MSEIAMSEETKATINITSHNQTGGITAHTVNIGKPQFELTDAHVREVLAATPKDRAVEVVAAGNARAHAMGNALVEALAEAGHQISRFRMYAHYAPIPEAPISVQVLPQLTRVIVYPTA
jgi:hypothetical protein